MKKLVSLLMGICFIACSSPREDYNLDFSETDPNTFKWHAPVRLYMQIDSAVLVNGKYPLLLEQKTDTDNGSVQPPLKVVLYQQIMFPSGLKETDPVFVSIHNKCRNLSQACLQLYCLDEHNKVVYSDTLAINNDDCWTERSLLFPVANARKMLIGLYALGYSLPSPEASIPQRLWLDRINLTLNGKNIEKYASPVPHIDGIIKEKDIFELNRNNREEFKKVIPAGKKIIGIGESMHGSKTMNHMQMELLKTLIESYHCKLVVFEFEMYNMLLWNLYIQGVLGDEYIEQIKKYAVNNLFSVDEITDFLIWLRKYNESADRKVNIRGMVDYSYNFSVNPLFDYVYAFYNEKSSSIISPLLSLIQDANISAAIELVRNSGELQQLMGISAYNDLLYGLLQLDKLIRNKDVEFKVAFHRRMSRDYSMYQNINRFINQNMKEEETVALIAHTSHLSKKGSMVLFPYINSIGYYLNWNYDEQYYSLALHVGEGSFSTKLMNKNPHVFSVETLSYPINNSLEKECLKYGKSCFYYSASDMNEKDLFYRNIGNGYFKQTEYDYNRFSSHFDGFIFIDKSEALSKEDIDYKSAYSDYLLDRISSRAAILKELKK